MSEALVHFIRTWVQAASRAEECKLLQSCFWALGVPLLHMHIGIRQHPEPGMLIAAALENPPCEQESGV